MFFEFVRYTVGIRWYTGLPAFWHPIRYALGVFLRYAFISCVTSCYIALICIGIRLTCGWYVIGMRGYTDRYTWVYGVFPFEPSFCLDYILTYFGREILTWTV